MGSFVSIVMRYCLVWEGHYLVMYLNKGCRAWPCNENKKRYNVAMKYNRQVEFVRLYTRKLTDKTPKFCRLDMVMIMSNRLKI